MGMQSRAREVEELLDLGSNDEIRVLGMQSSSREVEDLSPF